MTGKLTPTLVLASSSPYRRQLLERLKLDFKIEAPDIDEQPLGNESAGQYVMRLAENKAKAIIGNYPQALIIGSDQVAVLDQRLIGKPENHRDAIRQLNEFSGQTVRFLTGLCLLNGATGDTQTDAIPFDVEFRQLTPDMIESYLIKEQPYQCSGAFKSEGLGITLVTGFNGDDPTALIGLPLICLTEMLQTQGVILP